MPYRTKVWQKCKNQYGKNIKILIIVVELQNVWRTKFGDLVKFTKLLSYTAYSIAWCVRDCGIDVSTSHACESSTPTAIVSYSHSIIQVSMKLNFMHGVINSGRLT